MGYLDTMRIIMHMPDTEKEDKKLENQASYFFTKNQQNQCIEYQF